MQLLFIGILVFVGCFLLRGIIETIGEREEQKRRREEWLEKREDELREKEAWLQEKGEELEVKEEWRRKHFRE
jgi:hypothetical protein